MNADGLTVDVGRDQILIAADRDGLSVAVLVDGSEPVDHRQVVDALEDVGLELGHTAFVSSELLADRRARERRRQEREDDQEVVADGGEPLPIGVADPDVVDVEVMPWAEDLEVGEQVAFETPARRLEAEVVGFSTWPIYEGKPVVKPPPELETDGPPDLLVLREEDLVDRPASQRNRDATETSSSSSKPRGARR